MADSMTHSPTPWRIVSDTLIDADGNVVPYTPENCTRLMQAVNAHDDLVAALKALVKALTDNDDEGLIEHADQMIAARAALEKAGV